jgi:hypothetical protein
MFNKLLIESYVPEKGTQMGSNEGGIYTNTATGKKHYIKFYKNGDQAKTEALTGHIYNHLGINTVNPKHEVINGKHAVVSEWNPHIKTMRPKDFENTTPEQAHHIGRMYHAAVLTKNWDIVGLEHDNIMKHDNGNLHAIDHGGSFHFRARGGPKEYGSDIAEHSSLRNNNEASGHVFSSVFKQHPEAEKKGLDKVKAMDDSHIHKLFKNSGLSNWQELHQNFMKRKEKLLDTYKE